MISRVSTLRHIRGQWRNSISINCLFSSAAITDGTSSSSEPKKKSKSKTKKPKVIKPKVIKTQVKPEQQSQPASSKFLMVNNTTDLAEMIVARGVIHIDEISDIVKMLKLVQESPASVDSIVASTKQKKAKYDWAHWFFPWFNASIRSDIGGQNPVAVPVEHVTFKMADEYLCKRFCDAVLGVKKLDSVQFLLGKSEEDKAIFTEKLRIETNDICDQVRKVIASGTIAMLTSTLESFTRNAKTDDRLRKWIIDQYTFTQTVIPSFLHYLHLWNPSVEKLMTELSLKQKSLVATLATELTSAIQIANVHRIHREKENRRKLPKNTQKSDPHSHAAQIVEAPSQSDPTQSLNDLASDKAALRAMSPYTDMATNTKAAVCYRKFNHKHMHSIVFTCTAKNPGSTLSVVPPSSSSVDTVPIARYNNNNADESAGGITAFDDDRYKVFITNLPAEIDEISLALCLRKCGLVNRVALFKAYDDDEGNNPVVALTRRRQKPKSRSSKDEPKEVIDTYTAVNHASSKIHNKVKFPSRFLKVVEKVQSDNYAFVWMKDEVGYRNCLRDELRIFGLTVQANNCRIQPTAKVVSIVVEVLALYSTKEIHDRMKLMLDSYHISYSLNHVNEKPAFVVLTFGSHAEAWETYNKLLNWVHGSTFAYFKVGWIKTSWYRHVYIKAREIKINHLSVSAGAKLANGETISDAVMNIVGDEEDDIIFTLDEDGYDGYDC